MTSVGLFIVSMILWTLTTACTMTFSNTSTHGTAGNVADEEVTTDPKVDTDIKVPLK